MQTKLPSAFSLQRSTSALLAAFTLLVTAPFASAQPSIGVNFLGRDGGDVALQRDDVAGVKPQANWHNLPPNDGAGFDGTIASLADSQFLPTSVGFDWEANDAWNSDGADPSMLIGKPLL